MPLDSRQEGDSKKGRIAVTILNNSMPPMLVEAARAAAAASVSEASQDPVFAAIQAHHNAFLEAERVCSAPYDKGTQEQIEVCEAKGGPMDLACWAEADAMNAVCDTAPTTVIGAAAMACYIQQLVDQKAHILKKEQSRALGTLSRALASIAGQPMPVLPEYNP
jgi:hypothetical protein